MAAGTDAGAGEDRTDPPGLVGQTSAPPPSPAPETDGRSLRRQLLDLSRKYRVLLSIVIAAGFMGLGVFCVFMGRDLASEVTVVPVRTAAGEEAYVVKTDAASFQAQLWQAIGGVLIGAAAVSVAFEHLTRRASEQAGRASAELAMEDVGLGIADRIRQAVLGDHEFVTEVLRDERRQEYLEMFLNASLDPMAAPMAKKLAAQLSTTETWRDFTVDYRIVRRTEEVPEPEGAPEAGETEEAVGTTDDTAVLEGEPVVDAPPAPQPARVAGMVAVLTQTYTTDVRPPTQFDYIFQILSSSDAAVEGDLSRTFNWRYWLDPRSTADQSPEQAADVLRIFDVQHVKVNDDDAVRLPEPATAEDEGRVKRLSYQWSGEEADSYRVEMKMTLAPPRSGRYVYFNPGRITRGMEVRCVCDATDLLVTPVEMLRVDVVDQWHVPDQNPVMWVVRTNDWVLPDATVALTFRTS